MAPRRWTSAAKGHRPSPITALSSHSRVRATNAFAGGAEGSMMVLCGLQAAAERGGMASGEACPAGSSKPVPGAIRGPALTYTGDPFLSGLDQARVYEPDAII